AGERRQGLIRRIAIAGGAQGQGLPPSLPRLVQPIQPSDGRRTHVADPARRRQRRDVQQDAGRAVAGGERRDAHAAAPTAASTSSWASATRASRCSALLKLSA